MADTPDTPAPDAATPAPSGIKRRLPLLAALAGGLAVGAGTGAVVVGPVAARALGFSVTAGAEGGDGHEAAPADDHGADPNAAADSGSSSGEPLVATLDNLVLNPAASGGTRFLLLTVSMECSTEAAMTALKAKDAELRDVVLSTLARKTVDELADVMLRDGIKTELITALNDRFGKGTVVRVYFPQYVVQ